MIDSSSTHCINTAVCWEIHGRFFVAFRQRANLDRFRGHPGIHISGFDVLFESVRIKQAVGSTCLQFFLEPLKQKCPEAVSGDANAKKETESISVEHDLIETVLDGDGVVWSSADE